MQLYRSYTVFSTDLNVAAIKSLSTYLLAALLILTGSELALAQSSGSVTGNRQMSREQRTVAAFTKLHVSMGIAVDITDDPAGTVYVDAESNVMPHVLTTVRGDTLFITTDRNQPLQNIIPVEVRLGIDQLTSLRVDIGARVRLSKPLQGQGLFCTISSGGEVKANVGLTQLTLSLNGGAKVRLSGHVEEAAITLSGGSELKADELTASQCTISLSGGCDAQVHVDKSLTAHATGESRLAYSGNPSFTAVRATGASSISSVKN